MTPAVLLALAAACQGEPPAAELAVTTPPPSATAGGPGAGSPSAPSTARPSGPAPTPAGALPAYRALVADWQQSRSRFFTAVSDGRSRTVAEQRALAAEHLTGLRRFAAAVRAGSGGWPATAGAAARELLAANARQQATLVAMARAAGPAAFTAALADYGRGVAAEEQAIRAVERALTR